MANEEMRDRIERAVGSVMRPARQCAPARDEVAVVESVLAAVEDEAVERCVDELVGEMRLRSVEIRNGSFEMDITEAREMAAMYVAMAKTMLGDAENYSETPLEFHVKIAEEVERYILTVQRTGPGKLTPHEARRRAEAERDTALARIAELEQQLGQAPA